MSCRRFSWRIDSAISEFATASASASASPGEAGWFGIIGSRTNGS
jgi:hypothetical protein